MYCTHCGKKHEGGAFCIHCGARIAPPMTGQSPAPAPYLPNGPSKSAARPGNKKTALIVIGSVAAFVLVIAVLTLGKPEGKNTTPSYSTPYSNAQGYYLDPGTYSYGTYDDIYGDTYDDTYDDYDYYDYGSSTQTCTSCYGSGSCSFCHGTGQTSMYGTELSPCGACYGTGICTICDGDGVY